VGISIFPTNEDNSPDLMKLANEALYAFKNVGLNTFRFAKGKTDAPRKKNTKTKK
jgi:GGDEF domain-containing protein